MSTSIFETFASEVGPYRSGRSTLRFRADQPIPAALVRKVVKTRLRENAARARR